MTDPDKSPQTEVAAGDQSLDTLLKRHPTAISREELRAYVERERIARASWARKQAKKGVEE